MGAFFTGTKGGPHSGKCEKAYLNQLLKKTFTGKPYFWFSPPFSSLAGNFYSYPDKTLYESN
ncbi:MAG: hypothetical protein CR997_10980 [Acidobacteria bacterium]|nr:MAG: hypothetical protein CR997_10980 [Acidobacteriota bacterium]